MDKVNYSASADEAPLPPNGEVESPVDVVDPTNLVEAPPAPPAPPASPAQSALATSDTPNKRRAELSWFEGFPEKRLCLSPPKAPKYNGEAYMCPICFDCVRHREPVSTKCGHVYCKECIQDAIRCTHKCPLCKKKLTLRNFHRIFL